MKILITGINGFLGRNIALALVQEQHDIIGLDLQKKSYVSGVSNYYQGNVLDKDIVTELVSDVDVVIHLAALTAHKEIIDNKYKTLEINFNGTKNILDAFTKSKRAKKFIYSSSGKVYGDIQFLPITEKHPAKPINVLGKSKFITEQLIDFYATQEKELTVLRIFNVYGPGQRSNFLIPTILSQLTKDKSCKDKSCKDKSCNVYTEKKETSITLGDIQAQRDYVYIDDVVNAFVSVISRSFKPGFFSFNVASGRAVSASEIVDFFASITNLNITISVDQTLIRNDEKSVEYGSYSLAKEVLNWQPLFSLEDGLRKMLNTLEGFKSESGDSCWWQGNQNGQRM